jgi:hypothetical protein
MRSDVGTVWPLILADFLDFDDVVFFFFDFVEEEV